MAGIFFSVTLVFYLGLVAYLAFCCVELAQQHGVSQWIKALASTYLAIMASVFLTGAATLLVRSFGAMTDENFLLAPDLLSSTIYPLCGIFLYMASFHVMASLRVLVCFVVPFLLLSVAAYVFDEPLLISVLRIGSVIYAIGLMVMAAKAVPIFNKQLLDSVSDIYHRSGMWVYRAVFSIAFMGIARVVSFQFDDWGAILFYLYAGATWIYVFRMLRGLRDSSALQPVDLDVFFDRRRFPAPDPDDPLISSTYNRTLEYCSSSHVLNRPDLTIFDVAAEMRTDPKLITRALHSFNTNFYEMISDQMILSTKWP